MDEEDVQSRASAFGWNVYTTTAAFRARFEDEIDLDVGDDITVMQAMPGGWWEGINSTSSRHGWFPRNHVSGQPSA